MKQQADCNRTDRVFQEGDQVLLKLQPYVQYSVANRPYPKLAYEFFGPFTIVARVGTMSYQLALRCFSCVAAEAILFSLSCKELISCGGC